MISAVKYLNDALSESQIILRGLADRCSPGDREYETTIEFALGNCNAKNARESPWPLYKFQRQRRMSLASQLYYDCASRISFER